MSTSYWLRYKLMVIALTLMLSSAVNPAFSSELSDKRKQLNNTNSQLNETRLKIKRAKAQESQLVGQIESIDSKIILVQREHDRLSHELDKVGQQRAETERRLLEIQSQLWETERELDYTEAKLTRQKDTLSERIKSIYKHGKSVYLDVILNSTDFSSFLNRVRFLEYIVAQDIDLVEKIEETKASVEDKKQQVETSKADLNSERIKLIDEEHEVKSLTEAKFNQKMLLQSEIDKKQGLLSQIKSNRAAYELAENQLLETSASLASKIRQLEQSKRNSGSGKYARPTGHNSSSGFAWPTNGPITSPFGMRKHPILGDMRMHTGIDIGAPYGQAVIVAQDGDVIQAGWIKGYGQTIIISHGDGISSLYAHLSEILVSDGQSVSRGATIGRIGSTGLSTGPHLHFEIRRDGEPQDPMSWY